MLEHRTLLEKLTPIAQAAGRAIMEVYTDPSASARQKGDGSPVTLADERAEVIVLAGLKEHAPDIAVVSEENAASHSIDPPERYFLVDPLDGTREFIKHDGRGAFTVNIALIENGVPTLGIIHAPALGRTFTGSSNIGAFEGPTKIEARSIPASGMVALASLSHLDEQTKRWLADHAIEQTSNIGSSLKFCLLARGEADVYPRFSPTMEWDTAAGHAILNAAGGRMENPDGTPFAYGKPGFRNGDFIAYGCLKRVIF